jgi:hypothetical protein
VARYGFNRFEHARIFDAAAAQIALDHAAAQRGVGIGLCGWRRPERRAGRGPTLQREHCRPG